MIAHSFLAAVALLATRTSVGLSPSAPAVEPATTTTMTTAPAVPATTVPMALTVQGRAERRVPAPSTADLGLQPFALHAQRIAEALADLGAPLSAVERREIDEAQAAEPTAELVARLAAILDRRTLIVLTLNPEGRAHPTRGLAAAELDQHDARTFLVRIENGCGSTASLRIQSPQAVDVDQEPARGRWLDMQVFVSIFLRHELSGLPREYHVVSLGSAELGRRAATFRFDLDQGTQSAASPNAIDVLFDVRPAVPVTLVVRDEDDEPAIAAFTVRDEHGGIHPAQALRTGADFRFQRHVYRADGETLWLQPGHYTVECAHGPEYVDTHTELDVAPPGSSATASTKTPAETPVNPGVSGGLGSRAEFRVRRWIDPARLGWWSGDHHVHAAGCAHFKFPGVGVTPSDVLRHTRGEDLKMALCLTWGVGWDFQRQFFTGAADVHSKAPFFLRYDLEVSGFGSQRSGHLCLLGLKDQDFNAGHDIVDWPVLGLATLRWAKAQGAVTGTAHSGLGLAVDTEEFPNFVVPPFDSVGANEFVVDVTHDVADASGALVPAVDFYGVADTPWRWELNLWYHVLNVGFRPRLAGETDFPCLTDQRVGAGRSYVHIAGEPSMAAWIAGLAAGRSYVGDGRSHLIDFSVDGVAAGDRDLALDGPKKVAVRVTAAALLPLEPDARLAALSSREAPYWHLERARIAGTREVDVECVVDGKVAATQKLVADGTPQALTFDVAIAHSSWIAVRILPSCHTNPVFVTVGGAPLRASRASAEFLLQCVDRCWSQKARFFTTPETLAEAAGAYEHARAVYRARLAETPADR